MWRYPGAIFGACSCLLLYTQGPVYHVTALCVTCIMSTHIQDVSLKLLLDAARGLAYMHDVDVVHGDVKSRNLLVFWEEDEEERDQQQDPAAAVDHVEDQPAGPAADQAAAADEQQVVVARSSSPRPPVWGLKWCDFGVSFRAAEAPGGILKTVRECVAWQPRWCCTFLATIGLQHVSVHSPLSRQGQPDVLGSWF